MGTKEVTEFVRTTLKYYMLANQWAMWPTEATDNASVNFVKYNGDYYVSTETNYMRRINPQSLETKEKVSWWLKLPSLGGCGSLAEWKNILRIRRIAQKKVFDSSYKLPC